MKSGILLAAMLFTAGCTEEQMTAFNEGWAQGQQRTSVTPQAAQTQQPYCKQLYVSGSNGTPGQWKTVCGQ